MRKFYSAIMALTVLLFASCDKNEGDIGTIDDGIQTKMGLSFSFPGAATRAIVDENATTDEKNVKDVTVFIFDANGNPVAGTYDDGASTPYLAVNTIPIADFEDAGNNKYNLKDGKRIKTTTGARKIYVGMNLPDGMKGFTTEAALKAEMTIVMADLTKSTGMAMFSTAVKEMNLVLDESENVVKVTVERMVAKVGASYASGKTASFTGVGGADFTITKFGIGQDGKKMFPIKQYSAGKQVTPGSRNVVPSTTGWKSVNPSSATVLDLNTYYIGENISPQNLRGEVTYAVFQATFKPVDWTDAEGNQTPNSETVPKDTWVVTDEDGAIYYCKSAEDANALALLKNGSFKEYAGGYCYYNVYLNIDNDRKYEVYRNDFFHLEVSDLTGLGYPGDPDEGGEEPDPDEPKDPELPVDNEPTTLLVNVTVEKWNYPGIINTVLE